MRASQLRFVLVLAAAFSAAALPLTSTRPDFVTSASSTPLRWGPIGHNTTAEIAQALLGSTSKAMSRASALLPQWAGGQLAAVANWADEAREKTEYKWSETLHFLNAKDGECTVVMSRDCGDNACVVGAINNYTGQLSAAASPYNLTEALMFAVHFVGDVHQPLHVSWTTDEGGNKIEVDFFGTKRKLHQVWDTSILERHIDQDFGGDHSRYLAYLLAQISGAWAADAKAWAQCPAGTAAGAACPEVWAGESLADACADAYKDAPDGATITEAYYQRAVPVIDQRLAAGGVRLAATLAKLWPASK